MHPYRTHTCNELRASDAGKTVRLSGWMFRLRDHGGILFVDLRDHYGLTQIVVHPSRSFFGLVEKAHLESVITVTGEVKLRTPDTINPELPTGEIEIEANELVMESASQVTPLYIPDEKADESEDVRLQYRFLDLRREKLHKNIILRSEVIRFLREQMWEKGFHEFQTPILTASSPEGARDYLVPSRIHRGMFYALPQAPQMFKQLLMVSGFDKYFQIAPCFRDEAARADRSPGEFYQMDIEMSYATQDEIFAVVEDVVGKTFKKFSTWECTEAPWPRIKYRDAMMTYGSDKPDLRNPLKWIDMSPTSSRRPTSRRSHLASRTADSSRAFSSRESSASRLGPGSTSARRSSRRTAARDSATSAGRRKASSRDQSRSSSPRTSSRR